MLGVEIASNPFFVIHLNGPIVGVRGSYQLDFDSLQFYVDIDYCYRSAINPADFPALSTTQLGIALQIDLIPAASGAQHELGGGIFAQDPCIVQHLVMYTDYSLLTISYTQAIIGALWSDSTLIIGSHVIEQATWIIFSSY